MEGNALNQGAIHFLNIYCFFGQYSSDMMDQSVQFSSVAQLCPALCDPMINSEESMSAINTTTYIISQ